MTAAGLRLTRAQRDQIVAHALGGRPYEACGLLGLRGGALERFYPTTNKEGSRYRYEIDPRELLRILPEIEDAELDLGIYHSHTHTDAYPSETDVRLAYYPDALYVLVSLKEEAKPALRAFSIRDGRVEERPVELQD